MDTLLLAFIGVAIGLIVTPGADFAVVVRNSLHGSQLGLATAAGVIGGLILHTSLAVVGLAAVLAASPTLFAVLTVAGGGYLLYLGIRTLIGCVRRRVDRFPSLAAGPGPGHQTTLIGLRQGFLTNALNPKAPVLFLMLLPQFIVPGSPVVQRTILLSLIVVGVGIVWFFGIAGIIRGFSRILTRPRFSYGIELSSGLMITLLGILILGEQFL